MAVTDVPPSQKGPENRYQASFASDAPSSEDELDAHERVAASMDRLIAQSLGGKTIALEGRWGSGKSSVIRMLAEKCRTRNTLVYQYDAWAHAGDPLRRAFLASLIDFLTESGWLKDTVRWCTELDVLAGKRRDSEKTTSPLLTTFGLFLAISLLLVPGGLYCLSRGVEAIITEGSIYVPRWPASLFWLGAALCVSPIVLVLGNIAYCKGLKLPRPNYLAIALNRQTTIEKTSITEDGDQSTIEFQKVFGALMATSLASVESRKLVLVIDNLDRIDVGDVANVWSLLQSFVDIPRYASESWHKRLWVVVPVASEIENHGAESSTVHKYGASFLDKVFQARFRLPPPILKKWRPYLEKRLYNSIAGLSEDDCASVSEMFLASLRAGELPTPRELILFVNQLAIFAEQWGTQYAVSVGAAYILDKVDSSLSRLVSGELPTSGMQRLSEVDLKAAYASIFFNTGDEADALDLLQRPLASRLLSERDSVGISRNLAMHASFSHVLQRVLSDNSERKNDVRITEALTDFLTIARALDEDVLDSDNPAYQERSIQMRALRTRLARDVCLTVERLFGSIRFVEGYEELVSRLLKGGQAEELKSAVARELTARVQVSAVDGDLVNDNDACEVYSANTNALLAMNSVLQQVRISGEQVWVAASGLRFAKLLGEERISETDFLRMIKPMYGTLAEERYLQGEIASGEFGEVDGNIIRWLAAAGESPVAIGLDALATYAEKRSAYAGDYVLSVTSAIILSGGVGRGAGMALGRTVGSQKALASLFDALVSTKDYDPAAELIVLVADAWSETLNEAPDSFFKQISISKFLGDPSSVAELLSAFKRRISHHELGSWLYERTVGVPELVALFYEYFKPLSTLGSVISVQNVDDLISKIDRIAESHPSRAVELRGVAISLQSGVAGLDGFLSRLLKSQYKWQWLAKLAEAASGERSELLGNVIEEQLGAVSAQEWLSSSKIFTWRERTATNLHELRPDFSLGSVADLVRALLASWAAAEKPGNWTPSFALSFVAMARKAAQLQIGREEAQRLTQAVPVAAKEYWSVAGPLLDRWISAPGSYDELPAIVHAIVYRGDQFALKWLNSILDANAQLRKLNGGDGFRGELHRKVRERISSVSPGDEVEIALTSLKRTIARCARSKGRSKRTRR